VEIVHDELRERVALQLAQIDSLDGKANFVLGSASLLTAGAAALGSAIETSDGVTPNRWCIFGWNAEVETLANVVIAGAFAAFVAVVICAYQAYRVRIYTVTPDPTTGAALLLDTYMARPKGDTMAMLASARKQDDLPNNEAQIKDKVRWTTWALKALLVESALLLTMAVLEVFA
jgi:hypothetical protein